MTMLSLATASCLAAASHAAAPSISGGIGTSANFNLTAGEAYLTQPDGQMVYFWPYGCNGNPAAFAPAAIANGFCKNMQVPGPTLVVTEGQTVTVSLLNSLPAPAGNTSILFPGFQVSASGGVTGLITAEAAPGGSVTYSFVASTPGTRSYYSGTQSDLQVEMGLFGAIIVLPKTVLSECTTGLAAKNLAAESHWGESDFRLSNASGSSGAAYDNGKTCYDREYLFQFSASGPDHPPPGRGAGACTGEVHSGDAWMQPCRRHGTLPSCVLHDQWAIHAR